MAELCAACIRFVASKYQVALDGSPDTLSLVDQYVREAREAYKARPESIDLVAPAVGSYLGEVMRQEFGGEWFTDGSHESWRLYFHNVYLASQSVRDGARGDHDGGGRRLARPPPARPRGARGHLKSASP